MNNPIFVVLFSDRLFSKKTVANKNKVITPKRTRCKYAITIGRNPNANWLSEGIVEPNCKNNFTVAAIALKAINHFPTTLIC